MPFSITPDSAMLFQGQQYVTAVTEIRHACATGALAVLSGEVGVGKTLIVRCVMRSLPPPVRVAYLINPLLDFTDLLKTVCTEFELDADPALLSFSGLYHNLVQHVLQRAAQGQRFVIIADEAHRLSVDSLELLRLLSNLETEQTKLISVILVGQPELQRTLQLRAMRPLRERIGIWVQLQAMRSEDCAAYVRHRIALTHREGDFSFTDGALWWVHRKTGGVPRRINLACERALMLACHQGTRRVGWRMARTACGEMARAWA
jgi:general secretion pathway protein A